MKVRDTDYLYATMNIRANEKNLLSSRGIERMIEAKTLDEVSKVLAEFGYGQTALLNIDDVIDSTRLRLLGVVEQDSAVSFNLSQGKPLPERSSAAKAFSRIAGRLDGKRIPLKLD